MPFPLAALTDEIAADLSEALRTLRQVGIGEVELRTVLGKNVLELSDAEAAQCRALLDREGFSVSGIASPIGKSPLRREADFERRRLRRAIELARTFGTRRIRVFSFYPEEGASQPEVDALVPEVTDRMRELARMAEAAGVLLVMENEFRLVGDLPHRIARILEGVGSPALRFAWDPDNFVHSGVARPFEDCWPLLHPYVACCHVKDSRRGEGQVVAGQGDGGWPQLVAALAARGGVPLVMEPHLLEARHSTGFSGPELFVRAVEAIRALLPAA